MLDTALLRRKEVRVSMRVFVNLCSSDSPSFEVAPTINISCHGAGVLTKKGWQPNQELSIRSIRGTLNSRARVVRCQPRTDNLFVIGIEIYSPSGDWTAREMTNTIRNGLKWGPRTGKDDSWW
jgi:hypothetical protein